MCNKRFSSNSLHEWCVNNSTHPDSSLLVVVGATTFSFVFVLLQVILLASVILESSFHRCVTDKDCHLGEWCSPALGGSFSTSPGVCFDCWSAKMFYDARFLNASYETYPDPYEAMAEAAGDEWLLGGSAHCNRTDRHPRRCDHLANSLESLTPLNLIVFVCTAVMIVGPILDDVDEAYIVARYATHHAEYTMPHGCRRLFVEVLTGVTSELRRWVLPMMTVGAGLGLLLGASLSAQNLLLNGIAITFVTTMDNTLCWIFIRPQPDEVDAPKEHFPIAIWLMNRLYTLGLFIGLVLTVSEAEDFLSTYGNEAKYGAVCSDIREIVTVAPYFLGFPFALLSGPLQFSLRWLDKKCAHREEQKQRSLCEWYAGWPYLGPRQWYWVQVSAQVVLSSFGPPWMVYFFRNAFVAQGALVMLQIGDTM